MPVTYHPATGISEGCIRGRMCRVPTEGGREVTWDPMGFAHFKPNFAAVQECFGTPGYGVKPCSCGERRNLRWFHHDFGLCGTFQHLLVACATRNVARLRPAPDKRRGGAGSGSSLPACREGSGNVGFADSAAQKGILRHPGHPGNRVTTPALQFANQL